ncbi:MAG: hypothetical protein KKD28_14185 [Chloroflexi bacterium]|nr:hypothetical protein [Chloroflexota bacterium]MBU1662609.1 hypothetical protein [Chloroflexota bacterium]
MVHWYIGTLVNGGQFSNLPIYQIPIYQSTNLPINQSTNLPIYQPPTYQSTNHQPTSLSINF